MAGTAHGGIRSRSISKKDVVNAIVNAGAGRVGLEAGSKSVYATSGGISAVHPGATVICNGYKDRELYPSRTD